MQPARPDLDPATVDTRAEMESMQEAVVEAARFEDSGDRGETLLVAGIDQAFMDDEAISAVTLLENGEEVEQAHAVTPLSQPYIPGLLAFREGPPIVAALSSLSRRPDVMLFDGSGRIHQREAGIATHMGVYFDVPAVGVAKGLLCGEPASDCTDLETGERVPILADDSMAAANGTLVGYAVQTRQFAGENRHVNPVYVSPGHRMGAETAADIVLEQTAGYKLPEPIRRADALATEHANQ